MLVWSYGGGTQTAAIAVLVLQGQLPKPDIAVMADTGRELQSTWDYLYNVVQPGLSTIGLTVQVATHELATVDMYAHNDDLLLPAYVRNSRGKIGKMPTLCSNEWKQRVIRRWLREQAADDCDVWLGISTDEIERMRPSSLNWYRHVYPLIELAPTSRAQCAALVEAYGWPHPPKSRCWMCPNQSTNDWRRMKAELPGEFAKAVRLEAELQVVDADVYLHRAAIPLVDAVERSEMQSTLFDGCDSGYCFV